jgi:hypothetical protein
VTPQELAQWLNQASRRMPLARPRPWNRELSERLLAAGAAALFPGARSPAGALAGLMLYLGEWDRAHELAQELPTPEGAYWHAIIHRQEPDAWNSKYWFRQVGRHAIFPALAEAAHAAGFASPGDWRPAAFVDYCENARQKAGGPDEERAREIQHIEWKMLFDYCRNS